MSLLTGASSSRREFFRDAARGVLLSLLAVVAAVTARQRGLSGQRCVNRGICSGCNEFASCGLPQALSARLARPDGSYETRKQKS